MALKGNLEDFTIAQLLNLINLARKSGQLVIDGQKQATVSFKLGKLIYAETNLEQGDLSHVLFRAGKLTQQQAKLIDERLQGKNDRQLGHRLIQSNLITQSDIIQSIRSHILNVVYRLFLWSNGEFRFEDVDDPCAARITIPIDLDQVIVEGSRRLEETERLNSQLPDLDANLSFTEDPNVRLRSMNLTADEWRIISEISPDVTIKQIADSQKISDFQVRRTVHGLVEAGIVKVSKSGKAESEPSRAQWAASRRQPQPVAERRNVVNRLIDRIRSL